MNFFKVSLITASFLLIGCGGGGSDTPVAALTSVKTVEEAKTSYKVVGSFETIDISKATDGYSKLSYKMQKSESDACTDGGTLSYNAPSSNDITITYNNCQVGSQYHNGSVIMHLEDNNNYTIEISNYTFRDVGGEQYMDITIVQSTNNDITTVKLNGQINQTSKSNVVSNMAFDNMVMVEKDTYSESWVTIDGGINLKSKCVTGNYQFTTVEKLVEAKDGTDNTESGILEINGARYTFENSYVTIKVDSEEKTMLQSELQEEMESSNCSSS